MARSDSSPNKAENAGGMMDTAKQAATDVRDQASDMASQATQTAKRHARSMLESQKEMAADRLEGIADMFRDAADRLDQEVPGSLSGYAQRAVSGLDNAAHALREKNIDTLIADTENFARRQPTLFLAGAVVVGFALARFLKSSSQHRYQASESDGSYDRGDTLPHERSQAPTSTASLQSASNRAADFGAGSGASGREAR